MTSAAPQEPGPLDGWRFVGTLRKSQRAILDTVTMTPGEPLHIVAPPGSGKTLIGLSLAMRHGGRALVLAPTTTIRGQWAKSARSLAAGVWDGIDVEAGRAGESDLGDERRVASVTAPPASQAVTEDPSDLGDLTVLTYQMLGVLGASNPFDTLAADSWRDELVEGGRSVTDASAWLAQLSETNRRAYLSGLRRRSRKLRREVVRQDPERLAAALHPNARALIQRLVDHGITTIVLDECHHLLDHWAIVVHCLAARIREAGTEPLIIGLTATLPSPEDREEYENYTGLLGEVDYELPTPAVVKEGNLAPYRDLAWFVTPTEAELTFLRTQEAGLEQLIADTLDTEEGRVFIEAVLLGNEAHAVRAGSGARTGSAADSPDGSLLAAAPIDAAGNNRRDEPESSPEQRIAEAFKRDHVMAEAAARMLAALEPQHPVLRLFGREMRAAPTTEQRIRLLARYALEQVLPDPGRFMLWQRMKRVLADFGFLLTDRGIRRGRDPIDQVLATSAAKDLAIGQILRVELGREAAGDVRAVAILDFAVHGHGGGNSGDAAVERAGALRCFETVAQDPTLVQLRPILVTGKHLRIATRDAALLVPLLGDLLDATLDAQPAGASGEVSQLDIRGLGSAAVVAAVSQLVTDGTVRLIVGTRGLLGEGWDCPAVNTLIDLSSVATSSATQQLVGRTLRLDPAWPAKVAHNWAVTAVIEADVRLDGNGDIARLARKHSRTWGMTLDEPAAIVRGLGHTLTAEQAVGLTAMLAKEKGAPRAVALNDQTREALRPRAVTRARWGIGEPYLGEQREALFVDRPARTRSFAGNLTLDTVVAAVIALAAVAGGVVLQIALRGGGTVLAWAIGILLMCVLLISMFHRELRWLWLAARRYSLPGQAYQGAALALSRVLQARGETPAFGRDNIVVTPVYADRKTVARYDLAIVGGSATEQNVVFDALEELFGPVREPRFLLEIGVTKRGWGTAATWLAARILAVCGGSTRYLAVPKSIGRKREDAQAFAAAWQQEVGPCILHEIDAPEKLALLTRARRLSALPQTRPDRREVWA